jgi:hypothetical protein
VRGLCKTWKRCFDCDLTAHPTLTLDRLNWNCNRFRNGLDLGNKLLPLSSTSYGRQIEAGIIAPTDPITSARTTSRRVITAFSLYFMLVSLCFVD